MVFERVLQAWQIRDKLAEVSMLERSTVCADQEPVRNVKKFCQLLLVLKEGEYMNGKRLGSLEKVWVIHVV